jgi:hypothetical protein
VLCKGCHVRVSTGKLVMQVKRGRELHADGQLEDNLLLFRQP